MEKQVTNNKQRDFQSKKLTFMFRKLVNINNENVSSYFATKIMKMNNGNKVLNGKDVKS